MISPQIFVNLCIFVTFITHVPCNKIAIHFFNPVRTEFLAGKKYASEVAAFDMKIFQMKVST